MLIPVKAITSAKGATDKKDVRIHLRAILFDFDTETSINGNKLEIELRADVFKQALKNKYPFEMQVILKGFFSMDSDEPTVNVNMFEKNAIAILFPYLRSIVSTYTVNANVPPVLLPAMNINEYIRRKYQNGEEQA